VLELLADLPQKNCWSIAEHAGDRDPHAMQYLLAGRARGWWGRRGRGGARRGSARRRGLVLGDLPV